MQPDSVYRKNQGGAVLSLWKLVCACALFVSPGKADGRCNGPAWKQMYRPSSNEGDIGRERTSLVGKGGRRGKKTQGKEKPDLSILVRGQRVFPPGLPYGTFGKTPLRAYVFNMV